MSGIKTDAPTSWEVVPLQDFNNLAVIRKKEDGEVIATVDKRFADAFKTIPELQAVISGLSRELNRQFPQRGSKSLAAQVDTLSKQLDSIIRPVKTNQAKTA